MADLSILVPARNEIFLGRTIQDLLAHVEADTEIIAVLDGYWPQEGIPQHERVTVLHYPESIGQRAATNAAARVASGRYLMKVDAHCAFARGFDRILLEDMRPGLTMVPIMRNLHAFDWVCPNGHRRYQGRSGPCAECGRPTTMDVVWIAKTSPQSTAYRFDSEPHFQYFNEFKKRPEGQGDLTETMSLQGSCWMLACNDYFAWDVCDEAWGSWGSQGIEVAFKTWMNGGRVVCNQRTWYAHLFRTQGGDFSFPYPMTGAQQSDAKHRAREFIHAHPDTLAMLLDRFAPVPGWERPRAGIVYYTCNTHRPEIDDACRAQLAKSGLPIIAVSLNKDLDFGDTRVRMDGERGPLMMHRQILRGLHECDADYVFLCESDVLYHPSHFDFVPPRDDVFYYNTNVWRVRYPDGLAVWTDNLQQVSGLCASRELLIDFYTKRIAQIETEGFNRHYEPGVKQTVYGYHRGGKYGVENRQSAFPNLCIRHDANLTASKWAPGEFRDQRYARGWTVVDELPEWGGTARLMEAMR